MNQRNIFAIWEISKVISPEDKKDVWTELKVVNGELDEKVTSSWLSRKIKRNSLEHLAHDVLDSNCCPQYLIDKYASKNT